MLFTSQNNVLIIPKKRKCLDVSQKGRKPDSVITRYIMIVFIASDPHDTDGGVGGGIRNLQKSYCTYLTEQKPLTLLDTAINLHPVRAAYR